MYASIFIIFVSAMFYSRALSEQIEQQVQIKDKATDIVAWTEESVELLCGGNPSVQRYWKRGEEILTKANVDWTSNSRIESLNNSIVLRINNVSVDDEGQYTCVINSKPIQKLTFNLHVKELTCESPEKPLNGYFKGESRSSQVNSYKVNERIQYSCNRGFELVGEAMRTCSGPPTRWTPQEPLCEPDYIVRLHKAVRVFIGNKMTTLENKITTMENRMRCEKKCECGFTKLGDHCYYFGQDVKTQPEALSVCRSLGSTLAYPKNSVENTLLKDYVRKNFKAIDWWLDGSDAAKEDTWVWAHDQSPITYTDWNPGEPNNGGSPGAATESCLFIGGQTNNWHDAYCNWKVAFICQRNVSVQFVCN